MHRLRKKIFPGGIDVVQRRVVEIRMDTPPILLTRGKGRPPIEDSCGDSGEDNVGESTGRKERRRKESGEMEMGYRSTDRYLVISQLGRGGMATVYGAMDQRTGGCVALKKLDPCYQADRIIRERFRMEADIGMRLNHPNLIQVGYSVEGAAQGPFIVMEQVDGFNLKEQLRHGPLDVERAVEIVLQLCEGLAAAHTAGIVHRDVKPSNILVSTDSLEHGRVKLIDFGIAKDMRGKSLDERGVPPGTVGYMAPEQILDQPDTDHRADIYAAGVVLFEMLTGREPFESESLAELLYLHCTATPPRLQDVHRDIEVPAGLEEVVRTALEKDKGNRFPNMEQMRTALTGFL